MSNRSKNQQVGLHQSKTSEQQKKLLTKWKCNLQCGWKYFQIRYRFKGLILKVYMELIQFNSQKKK